MVALNLLTEDLITLPQAASEMPVAEGKSAPHYTTVYRWATNGLSGDLLESIKVGNQILTSRQAVTRFLKRLNEV